MYLFYRWVIITEKIQWEPVLRLDKMNVLILIVRARFKRLSQEQWKPNSLKPSRLWFSAIWGAALGIVDANNFSVTIIVKFPIVWIVQYCSLIVGTIQISSIFPDFNMALKKLCWIFDWIKMKNLTLCHIRQQDKSCYSFW